MQHGQYDQSKERKQEYQKDLRQMGNADLLQCFIAVYLDQDFPTDFDRWMADMEIGELKHRFLGARK